MIDQIRMKFGVFVAPWHALGEHPRWRSSATTT